MVVAPESQSRSTEPGQCDVHPPVVIEIQSRNADGSDVVAWGGMGEGMCGAEFSLPWILEYGPARPVGRSQINRPVIVVVSSDRVHDRKWDDKAPLFADVGKGAVPVVLPHGTGRGVRRTHRCGLCARRVKVQVSVVIVVDESEAHRACLFDPGRGGIVPECASFLVMQQQDGSERADGQVLKTIVVVITDRTAHGTQA